MSEIIIKGAYADAKVFTVNDESRAVEQYALAQIRMLCDNPASEGSKMRVMPDVHPGKVGTIGLTMTVGNKILPEVVGIKGFKKEFQAIDRVIAERIPSGVAVRKDPHPLAEEFDYGRLFCHKCINLPYIKRSMGSLGSGNHFIEIDRSEDGGIIGVGKGNPDWNYSAPYGSGRLMKREDVKNRHTVSQFKAEMKGIYSSCIGKDTLDESPFAYRSMEDIREAIVDTVEIREIIRPIYNHKAGGKE